jgi:signal transduction histidine kinase
MNRRIFGKASLQSGDAGHLLPKVRWHQWSVVRLAAIAMITVLTGYLTAAVLTVKNIDQLLHIVHDQEVEHRLKSGLDYQKESYKLRQQLLVEKLRHEIPLPQKINASDLKSALDRIDASTVMRHATWSMNADLDAPRETILWLSRQELAVGPLTISFHATQQEEEYRATEEVLQRYQVLGLELRERIRPALIKALSITLAIMCLLLLGAFVYMAIRGKSRIQQLVEGFVQYAEIDDNFRFSRHWHNELGLLSRQFNHMADDLEANRQRATGLEKLASWQTIARKMAHEIKNPLTPIQIMIGQLKRNYDGHDPDYQILVEKAHGVILEEVASLRRMVDEFSQFAQLPSPRFEPKDATQTAKQTVALSAGAYAPHEILFEGSDQPVVAEFDDQLIKLTLHNLIKNAAEADIGNSNPIILRLKESKQHIIFEVEDHGPGIPESLKNSVFEAYVTTKHTGPSPGMGLGLAICQKVTLEHAGKISVLSKPGNTIFTIVLPRVHKGARP